MVYRPLQGRFGGIYWYILQTHSAAEVAFNRYWDLLRTAPQLMLQKPNESEKSFRLLNDSRVFFKSGQNFEDLRVETLDGAIIDEHRQQHPSLWSKVIRPMLARRGGWADIYSTPNGFEHFYDLFQAALLDPEWGAFHAPSTEAPWWTAEEIASARSTMSEAEFAQEIMAEFHEMGVGKVYLNHGSHNWVDHNPFGIRGLDWSQHLPIVVGLDFNVGMMCWELGQVKGRDIYYGDEIAISNTNTEQCAQVLAERVKGHKAGVVIVGDASGKARKTSSSETDYVILMRILRALCPGIEIRNLTPEVNPPVKDRVNIMNSALKSADGSVHFYYNRKKCPRLGRDLDRVTWKAKAQDAQFDKSDPLLTHSSDAAGYPVCLFANEFRAKPGRMHIRMA